MNDICEVPGCEDEVKVSRSGKKLSMCDMHQRAAWRVGHTVTPAQYLSLETINQMTDEGDYWWHMQDINQRPLATLENSDLIMIDDRGVPGAPWVMITGRGKALLAEAMGKSPAEEPEDPKPIEDSTLPEVKQMPQNELAARIAEFKTRTNALAPEERPTANENAVYERVLRTLQERHPALRVVIDSLIEAELKIAELLEGVKA